MTNSLSIFDHHTLEESPLVRNEIDLQGHIQDFWKGGSYIKKGLDFALLNLSQCSQIPHENEVIWSDSFSWDI